MKFILCSYMTILFRHISQLYFVHVFQYIQAHAVTFILCSDLNTFRYMKSNLFCALIWIYSGTWSEVCALIWIYTDTYSDVYFVLLFPNIQAMQWNVFCDLIWIYSGTWNEMFCALIRMYSGTWSEVCVLILICSGTYSEMLCSYFNTFRHIHCAHLFRSVVPNIYLWLQ